MEAKDGSSGFDFGGTYSNVEELKKIEYDFDGRQVTIDFIQGPDGVRVVQTFDPEEENLDEVQRSGWQGILENFKKHVEEN